ncbi:tyrosine-type recombinase/integrase [Acidipila sp. EB88]|uniref:tyrosine-type recombinase/integrase n=1 Tax=Acidipila sp. EB88 TaxID=2305226 RepID=UPI0013151376
MCHRIHAKIAVPILADRADTTGMEIPASAPVASTAPPDPLLRGYAAYLRVERGLQPLSVDAYQGDLVQFHTMLRSDREDAMSSLAAATRHDIARFLEELGARGISGRAAARKLSSLRGFYRWLLRSGRITTDPTLHISSPAAWLVLPKAIAEPTLAAAMDAASARIDSAHHLAEAMDMDQDVARQAVQPTRRNPGRSGAGGKQAGRNSAGRDEAPLRAPDSASGSARSSVPGEAPAHVSPRAARAALSAATALAADAHLAEALALRDAAMLEVLYAGGLRASEIATLSVASLDLEGSRLRVLGKGDRERVVPIGVPATQMLERYLQAGRRVLAQPGGEQAHSGKKAVSSRAQSRARPRAEAPARPGLVSPAAPNVLNRPRLGSALQKQVTGDPSNALFLTARGLPVTRQLVWQIVKDRVGPAASPHMLRHSCATHMVDHGADLRSVQTVLGHADITTTQIYTHVALGRLQAVHHAHHPREQRHAARQPLATPLVGGSATSDTSRGEVVALTGLLATGPGEP